MVLEAVDVTFQQSNRTFGITQGSECFVLGKHKLYGFKIEAFVKQNGIGSLFNTHYPRSCSKLSVMHENLSIHREQQIKGEENEYSVDNYYMLEKNST